MNKKGVVGWVILGVICLCALFVVGYAFKYAWLGPKTITTQIDSASEIIDKTYDPDNAIYNYEWFKTQYEKIEANRNQIENMITSLEEFKEVYGDNAASWDYETKQEYNRLNAIKVGLQNQDENLVAEYNARSKMANREIFKDKLPLSIDQKLW